MTMMAFALKEALGLVTPAIQMDFWQGVGAAKRALMQKESAFGRTPSGGDGHVPARVRAPNRNGQVPRRTPNRPNGELVKVKGEV